MTVKTDSILELARCLIVGGGGGGEWSRDGAVVRALASQQCAPGSIPRLSVICGLSLLLVKLVLASRGFSTGTPVFPSPQKPTFLNSNSIRKSEGHRFVSRNRLLSVTLVKQSFS